MKNLIAPHGSNTLKPLYIEDSLERNSLTEASKEMPKLLLNSAAAANTYPTAADPAGCISGQAASGTATSTRFDR